MAVTIRLSRLGRIKKPFYRIVVADKEMKRDGRFIEAVGTLNPLTNPPTINLKEDRVKHWITLGAWPSDTVSSVINKKLPGYLSDIESKRLEKVQSHRAKRKARAKARK